MEAGLLLHVCAAGLDGGSYGTMAAGLSTALSGGTRVNSPEGPIRGTAGVPVAGGPFTTDRWLPQAKIMHPWPSVRFDARTRGRSPVR